MPKKDPGKPKGSMTSYAAFVQVCREEHKKKHPGDQIVFAEFSKKCSERWKKMDIPEKKRFQDIADKDKARYQREMANYNPPPGQDKKAKKKKDPNAPKRALSAFFFFSGEFRAEIKQENPGFSVGDIAKELGKRWEKLRDRSKYEKMAQEDKKRYDKAMEAYSKSTGAPPSKRQKVVAPPPPEDDDDEEDDSEEEESD